MAQFLGSYYNEHDPKAAAWLRELIKHGHIAPGEVDERDIRDVTPDDLRGFRQHHFFAGIGVWSYALRQAGWPDDRPVWTGSCPCQPFSSAGKRKGAADDRHLWPAFHWLIRQYRPRVVFGEQVASKDGIAWLDTVSTDLEAEGYAVGSVVLPACGVGAPHQRARLWFVADTDGGDAGPEWQQRSGEHGQLTQDGSPESLAIDARGGCGIGGPQVGGWEDRHADSRGDSSGIVGITEGLSSGTGLRHSGATGHGRVESSDPGSSRGPGPTNGHWRDADWLHCRDGKWRPVEPGSFPLAHGLAGRVGRLRGYGNAIVAQAAAEVISAYREVRGV